MAPWDGFETDLGALMVYAVGIALYALAVALLYVPLGTRLMFAKRLGSEAIATAGRRWLYVLLFPFVSFAFFLVVAASMLFMASFSDDALSPRQVMTISMAVVLAVRVASYFSETTAADLAKVMPLSMLAVVLVTNGLSDLGASLRNLGAFLEDARLLALYFAVLVLVEGVLRLVYEILGRPNKDKPGPSPRLAKR